MRGVAFSVLFVFVLFVLGSEGLLEGYGKVEYTQGERITLYTDKLASTKSFVPYAYYKFPFCKPDPITKKKENIGQMMSGDEITESPYIINVLEKVDCKVLNSHPSNCDYYSQSQLQQFVDLINNEYQVFWMLDNLPNGERKKIIQSNGELADVYKVGYVLGNANDPDFRGTISINNHASITIIYNKKQDTDSVYIVGFEVEPKSIQYNFTLWNESRLDTCVSSAYQNSQPVNPVPNGAYILWTYSVAWEENQNIDWNHRWDKYVEYSDVQIHWFSFVNSLVILLFLTGVVAFIFVRKIRADFTLDGEVEEVGWKLIYGDVFRPPKWPNLLSALVGTGLHLLITSVLVLLLSLFGFLNPANRGSFVTTMLTSFILLSVFAGYFSERTLKVLHGSRWKRVALFTISAFSGTSFIIYFILNMILHSRDSSAALSAGTFSWIFVVWFFVPLILVLAGVIVGIKKYEYHPPARINQIPRQIPTQRWYVSAWVMVPIGGILPFAVVFVEYFFIINSLWRSSVQAFGFMCVALLLLIIVCLEISIILSYFQLCSEDYHWWWRSFLVTGSSAFYMFLYSIFYFCVKTTARGVSIVIYFGYMLIIAWGFFLVTGTIGFLASLWFITKLMTRLPID